VTHTTARTANLLGACALAVAERLQTSSETAALIALHTFLGDTSVDGLAHVLALTHSGTVRLVDRLEQAGLLERRAGADARTRAIALTADGHAEAARRQAAREVALLALLEPLSPAQRDGLAGALGAILGAITPRRDHAAAAHICRLCDPDACGHPRTCPVTLAARG
jgi:DNA-binding MarR family transcriptional regulator